MKLEKSAKDKIKYLENEAVIEIQNKISIHSIKLTEKWGSAARYSTNSRMIGVGKQEAAQQARSDTNATKRQKTPKKSLEDLPNLPASKSSRDHWSRSEGDRYIMIS